MKYKNATHTKEKSDKQHKRSSVHDLYPEGYCFDWETFGADPENYTFTDDDISYLNAMELERYELETPMTPAEKRALRRWVRSGHSVGDTPPSKYPCVHCRYPGPDFLEVYRTDKEIDKATKGMTDEEVTVYLKEYTGYTDESEEEREYRAAAEHLREQTPVEVREKLRLLQRKLFHIRMFISEKGFYDEANEYWKRHMDEPALFEDVW